MLSIVPPFISGQGQALSLQLFTFRSSDPDLHQGIFPLKTPLLTFPSLRLNGERIKERGTL